MEKTIPRTETARLKTGWGWVLAAGIAFIAIGFVALLQPMLTGVAAGVLFGYAIFVASLFAAVAGIANIRERGAWIYVLLGLFGIAVGVLTLMFPVAGALSLLWMTGAWLIAGGVLELMIAANVPVRRIWLILVGLLDIALGVVLLFVDPAFGLVLLGIAVGASLIYRGVASMMFALWLRDLAKAAD